MRLLTVVAALALPLLAGCGGNGNGNGGLRPPGADGLFRRYVSLGNSIAAGYQSGGINDSTQRHAFPVLVAEAMGAPFAYPSIPGRGCPPPLVNNVTGERVGGSTARDCDARDVPRPGLLNNLAVPGAQVRDLLTSRARILDQRTQVAAMLAARPTFVSVEIGANDVLGALLDPGNPGNPAAVTPPAAFRSAYGEVLDSVAKTGAKAVLIGVPDVTLIPFASSGAAYWCRKTGRCGSAASLPGAFAVRDNCAPGAGDSVLIPWTVGVARVLRAARGEATSVDCSLDREVVTPEEYARLRTTVDGYNAYIAAQAAARGWAYVDLNAPIVALRASGEIPAFPDLTSAINARGSVDFGPYFSLDGFHPSDVAHRVLADSVLSSVRRHYGLAE